MPKSSIELIRDLTERGIFSKEAAVRALKLRESMIKQALKKEAAGLFSKLRRGFTSAAAPKPSEGIFDRFRHGGFTPKPEGATAPAWGDVGSNITKMLALAGLTAGATAGISGLSRMSADKHLKDDAANSYKQMFEEYPKLKILAQAPEGAHKVRQNFEVLYRYAPSLAADPMVAGSFVQAQTQMGIVEPATVQRLAETQRRIDEMHEGRSPFGQSHLDRGLTLATRAMAPFGAGPKPA
jgi:hypothetical protein